MVLGGAADHAGAADVDLLDGLGGSHALPGDGGLEGVEVDHHQVDGLDALGLGIRHMLRQIPAVEEAPVDARVEGLHPAVEALRGAGVGCDFLGLQLGFLQGAEGPPGGQNAPALGQQSLRQGQQPRLVVHRDQCRRHVRPLNP